MSPTASILSSWWWNHRPGKSETYWPCKKDPSSLKKLTALSQHVEEKTNGRFPMGDSSLMKWCHSWWLSIAEKEVTPKRCPKFKVGSFFLPLKVIKHMRKYNWSIIFPKFSGLKTSPEKSETKSPTEIGSNPPPSNSEFWTFIEIPDPKNVSRHPANKTVFHANLRAPPQCHLKPQEIRPFQGGHEGFEGITTGACTKIPQGRALSLCSGSGASPFADKERLPLPRFHQPGASSSLLGGKVLTVCHEHVGVIKCLHFRSRPRRSFMFIFGHLNRLLQSFFVRDDVAFRKARNQTPAPSHSTISFHPPLSLPSGRRSKRW